MGSKRKGDVDDDAEATRLAAQNRKYQKAFREKRKDKLQLLENKVAELERELSLSRAALASSAPAIDTINLDIRSATAHAGPSSYRGITSNVVTREATELEKLRVQVAQLSSANESLKIMMEEQSIIPPPMLLVNHLLMGNNRSTCQSSMSAAQDTAMINSINEEFDDGVWNELLDLSTIEDDAEPSANVETVNNVDAHNNGQSERVAAAEEVIVEIQPIPIPMDGVMRKIQPINEYNVVKRELTQEMMNEINDTIENLDELREIASLNTLECLAWIRELAMQYRAFREASPETPREIMDQYCVDIMRLKNNILNLLDREDSTQDRKKVASFVDLMRDYLAVSATEFQAVKKEGESGHGGESTGGIDNNATASLSRSPSPVLPAIPSALISLPETVKTEPGVPRSSLDVKQKWSSPSSPHEPNEPTISLNSLDSKSMLLATLYFMKRDAPWFFAHNGINDTIAKHGRIQLFLKMYDKTEKTSYSNIPHTFSIAGFSVKGFFGAVFESINAVIGIHTTKDFLVKSTLEYWLSAEQVEGIVGEKVNMKLEIRQPNGFSPPIDPFPSSDLNKIYEANGHKPFHWLKIRAVSQWGTDEKYEVGELETESTQPKFDEIKIPGTFDVAMTSQPVSPFLLSLYDYQRRTLNWMQMVEDGIDSEYYAPGVAKMEDDKYFVVSKTGGGLIKSLAEIKVDNPTVRSGIIADKPGVGKTITTLALCQTRPCQDPDFLYSIDLKTKMFKSRATIIFVPNNISSQWMTEIKKCFGTNIDAIEIKGKRSYEGTTLKQLLECDIVIVSYSFLVNSNYIAARITSSNRTLEKHSPGVDFSNAEVSKDFVDSRPAGQFAFSWIHFHRVVYDEFHELDEKNNAIRTQLALMHANSIWGLTGTPKVDSEQTVSQFASYLKIQLYSPEYYLETRFRTLFWKHFLLQRIRRNEPEVHYPPPVYETIRVVQTAMEATLYQSSVGNKKEMENLVKLCNHYQIGNNLNPESGSDALTIEQVTDRVQKDRATKLKRLAKQIESQAVVVAERRQYYAETNFQTIDTRRVAEAAVRRAVKEESEMKEDLRSTQSQFNFFQNFLNSYMAEDNKIFCSVCWSDDIPRDQLALVPCGHVFCWECAEGVADRNKKCPQCMAPMTKDQIMKLKPPPEVVEAPENADVDHDEDQLDPNKFGSKIHELVQYLQLEMAACESHRFLVFIQWSDLADLVTQALNTFGIGTARLKSGWAQREGALKRFRAGLSTEMDNDVLVGGGGDGVGSSSSSSMQVEQQKEEVVKPVKGKSRGCRVAATTRSRTSAKSSSSRAVEVEDDVQEIIPRKRTRKPIKKSLCELSDTEDVAATEVVVEKDTSDFEPEEDVKGKRKAVYLAELPLAKRSKRGRAALRDLEEGDSEFESDGEGEEAEEKIVVAVKKDVKGKGKAVADSSSTIVKGKGKAVKVLMLSAKDSVSGLNLTEATHCIILHPFHDVKEDYAIGAEKQGVARTLRNGQTKTVKIVRFVVDHTVEQEMHDRRKDKHRAAQAPQHKTRESSLKRKLQNQLHQKTHRQKKAAQFAELQETVTQLNQKIIQLEAENKRLNDKISSFELSCSSTCAPVIQALRHEVNQLKRGQSQQQDEAREGKDGAAVTVYLADVKSTEARLKIMASLRNHTLVDELFQLYLNHENAGNAKKHMIQIIDARCKLLDAYNVLDRHAAVEVLHGFVERNRSHLGSIFTLLDEKFNEPSRSVNSPTNGSASRSMKPFKDALSQIGSLNGIEAVLLIDELCDLFWSDNVEGDRDEDLLRIVAIVRRLEDMCKNEEDHKRFLLATELAREGNKSKMVRNLYQKTLMEGKSQRGRKRKETDDAPVSGERDKRLANLEAQRTYQAKKKEYVASLEKELAQLRAVVAGKEVEVQISTDSDTVDIAELKRQIVVLTAENVLMRQNCAVVDLTQRSTLKEADSECANCASEHIRSLVGLGLVKSLELKVAELEDELKTFRNSTATSNALFNGCSGSLLGDQYLDGLFGFSSAQNDLLSFLNNPFAPTTSSSSPGTGMDWLNTASSSSSTSSIANYPNIPSIPIRRQPKSTASPSPPQNSAFQSATALFGPPECEFARIALKSIPSLSGCKHVDEIFDLFTLQSNSIDKDLIKMCGLKSMALRGKILDACSVVDRQKVIELIVIFLERNRNHVLYRNSLFEESAKSEPAPIPLSLDPHREIPEESKRFRAALVSIPSLSTPEASILVDELCISIWSDNVKGKGKEKLLKIFAIGKKLEKLCANVQDRTKYSLVTETFRESSKKRMDVLFEEVEV
ncbi:UNVERIFIED_CONTAM: DNA helicase rad5 [Siphonaria sp. JEL0065]|nr:DNA helicase rad5 [Siphonaria sp. JEL0065]